MQRFGPLIRHCRELTRSPLQENTFLQWEHTPGSRITSVQKPASTITAGKLADFVVFSDDILPIDPVKIADVSVELTIVGGTIVYRKRP